MRNMKSIREQPRNRIFTIFIISMCAITIYRNIFLLKNFNLFLWFCDFSPFIILIAIILKNKDLLNGLINLGLPIQAVYLIMNLTKLFLGEANSLPLITAPNFNPWNLNIVSLATENIFVQSWFLILIALFLHFVSIVSFIFFYNEKSTKKSIVYSMVLVFVMFLIGLNFPWEDNLNQVFSLYGVEKILPGYTQVWPIWILVIIILPTYKLRNKIAKQSS